MSEIPLTLFVTAIAIEFDCVASTFAGRAAIFATLLRGTSARRILAFFLFSHDSLPENLISETRRA